MTNDDPSALREPGSLADLVDAVARVLEPLPDKPEETAEATVRALWHKAAGQALSVQKAGEEELPALAPGQDRVLRELIDMRLAGTPLAYLTGRQQFMGLEFHVESGALIPRKETELLGQTALNLLADARHAAEVGPGIIDLCTGSGNLACALAVHASDVQVVGSDISLEALACARRNRQLLGLDGRVSFLAGDMLDAFDLAACQRSVAVIVCNPPYITNGKLSHMPEEIIRHEPAAAFDGGPLGVSILTRLVKHGANYLAGGGWVCCEVGLGQGPWLSKRFERTGKFAQVESFCDADGNVRVVAARKT